MSLPRLTGGATLNRQEKPPTLTSPSKLRLPAEVDKFAPQGLSGSREEEWIRQFLAKRQGYWRQQLPFGERFQPRATSADFYSDYYKAVIQADGAYFHDPKQTLDQVLSSVIRQFGYRVFRFRYETFEYVVNNFPVWYVERFA